MSASAQTPREVFEHWLEQQPDTARVVLACDTDRLLSDAKALDLPEVTDPAGRKWHLAIFRGDHLRFRFDFRKATRKGRTVVALVGSTQPDARVDVSLLSDVLARHEGTPLDLSLARYLGRFCPQINFPDQPLRHYRELLLARIPELTGAAKKLIARWGRPDDWGRPQVAALVLLAHAPGLALDDLWPDGDSPEEFIAHGVRLLLARPELKTLRDTVRDFLRSAALPTVAPHLHWFQLPVEELAAYLVLREFAAQHELQNPTAQLAGIGLLSADQDWSRCESLAWPLVRRLRTQGAWPQIEQAAAPYLNPKRVEKLLSLVGAEAADVTALAKLTASVTVPPVRRNVLQRLLVAVLANPAQLETAAQALKAAGLAPGFGANEPPDAPDSVRQVQAGLGLLSCWQRIEQALAQPMPTATQPTALLAAYQQGGWFRLDADLASLSHLALRFGDDEIIAETHALLFGESGHETRPLPGSLKDRARITLQELDEQLAEFIRPSPEAFASGAWCATVYIRSRLRERVTQLSLGHGEGRVWILVFDGMRFDTWSLVARAILAEHFQITDERALFCVPPSFTTVARTSLFAGAAPAGWRGFQNQITSDEAALVAVNLGLTQPEAKAKLRLLKEAETLKARAKLAATDTQARLVNVLIYGIADDCHEFAGDYGRFHQKISADLIGNRAQGTAGILDDLLRRVQPEDEVVLVSDHGFTELLEDDGDPVTTPSAPTRGRIQWMPSAGVM
ncbi:MAG: PglZ domain-containing protein [Verrucomicrobia bacterium]|nr:PglZ domain-containing protein [Verrucomicrobiota bacterium]